MSSGVSFVSSVISFAPCTIVFTFSSSARIDISSGERAPGIDRDASGWRTLMPDFWRNMSASEASARTRSMSADRFLSRPRKRSKNDGASCGHAARCTLSGSASVRTLWNISSATNGVAGAMSFENSVSTKRSVWSAACLSASSVPFIRSRERRKYQVERSSINCLYRRTPLGTS